MILKSRKRHWLAYKTAIKIMFSYLRIYAAKKIFGVNYFNKRIEKVHINNAIILKKNILHLSGLFIKVGQLISIMSNAIPPAYGNVLESLQDDTPHSDFDIIKATIETQFKNDILSIFKSFDKIPIASASIGQVHKAVLHTGETVAVKIQFDYIKELAKVDLSIIENLIKFVLRFFKIHGLEHVYLQVKQMISEELDYEHEALMMQQISDNCKNIEKVIIPKVFNEFSSALVLTTLFYDGVKITNINKLKEWDLNVDDLSKRLTYVYCEMILNHGLYHADPHPGNLLINKNGNLIILDFGSVATLSEHMPKEIVNLVQSIFIKDEKGVLNSLRNMGFLAKGKQAEETAIKLIEAVTSFIQEGIDITNLSLDDLDNESIKNLRSNLSIKELTSSIQVPKDWILLDRTIKLLQGVSLKIAPNTNPTDTVLPYLKRMSLKNGGFKDIIVNVVKKQAGLLISLPEKTAVFLTKANKGELEIKINNENHTNKMYAVIQQLIFVIITLFSLSFAYFSKTNNEIIYEKYFHYSAIIFGFLFVYSMWKNRK